MRRKDPDPALLFAEYFSDMASRDDGEPSCRDGCRRDLEALTRLGVAFRERWAGLHQSKGSLLAFVTEPRSIVFALLMGLRR